MFLSADETFVEELTKAGLTRDGGTLYAVGRIVLFAPTGSPLNPREGLDGLARLLTSGRVTRFAIANPEHAPYGRAAEARVTQTWPVERSASPPRARENVSQAAQFATTGNAVGGIIAYSLALAPNLKDRGTYALIPDADHEPLRQRMVLLKRAGPIADRFYRYLQQPAARAQRAERWDGVAGRERQPHQEGLLPPRDPRDRHRRVVRVSFCIEMTCWPSRCSWSATWCCRGSVAHRARHGAAGAVRPGARAVLSVFNVYFRDTRHLVEHRCCRCGST